MGAWISRVCPSSTWIWATRPATGATYSFCIFMASRISRGWPSSTSSPSWTKSFSTLPGIRAFIRPSPACLERAMASASRALWGSCRVNS